MSREMRDAARDAQMQHDYAEICESRKVDWDDWELAWFLGAKFVQAEKDALEGALRELRKIAAFVPAKIYIVAKEKAGFAEQVKPVEAALKGDKKS